ncbi:MAG TPA: sigma-70 family RNA polymerase sigma factor [Solirubrobacteraceae bacterium]|jgi:RNA polymerase sigma-70 factor (ECF subfamily)|nr:sigma-70 family RNA polymerase sigma factor [Solirubrobacteraceae bacterium]
MTETADRRPRRALTDRQPSQAGSLNPRPRPTCSTSGPHTSEAGGRSEAGGLRKARERRRAPAADLAAQADDDLIGRMQAGDVMAFAALYDRYCDKAFRVARMVSGDRARAEEAVQEAFGAIWSARATYRPQRPSAAGWILTVVRNRAIDGARHDATLHSRRAADAVIETYPAAHDVAAEALDRVAASELKLLLERLPDAQREVIVLAFYGQLSHAEIADQLDAPLGTIKARMRRGLHALRGELLDDVA